MEEISFEGEKYVKAGLLAKKLGYTADYVGQLCRADSVKAQLVGRSWYVEENSLREHKKKRYRSNLTKSKQEINKQSATVKPKEIFAGIGINQDVLNYEQDSSDLLPTLAKLEKKEVNIKIHKNEHTQEKYGYVPYNKSEDSHFDRPKIRIIKSGGRSEHSPSSRTRRSHLRPKDKPKIPSENSVGQIEEERGIFTASLLVFAIIILIFLTPSLFLISKQVEVNQDATVLSSYGLSDQLYSKIKAMIAAKIGH